MTEQEKKIVEELAQLTALKKIKNALRSLLKELDENKKDAERLEKLRWKSRYTNQTMQIVVPWNEQHTFREAIDALTPSPGEK
jgi:predicted component of type VI protein secretion system